MAILAIESPTYQPAMRIINSITQARRAVIETTFDHDYESGLIVRITIPIGFGMQDLNTQFGEITVLSDTTFSIPVDTTEMDPFVIPDANPGHFFTQAQVVPIAEKNSSLLQATRNVL